MFNYLEKDNQEKWKKRLYDMALEGESDELKKTMYQVLFCDSEKAWWDSVFKLVTPAGKPSYKPPPAKVITPMEFIKQKIEMKVQEIIDNDKTGELAEHLLSNQAHVETTSHQQILSERSRSKLDIQNEDLPQNNKGDAKAAVAVKRRRVQSAQQRKGIDMKIEAMKTVSKWLPDSAITTYFGKPAFHAYGNGNTKPTVGGSIYGDYLKTHNVNPQSGDNQPEYK